MTAMTEVESPSLGDVAVSTFATDVDAEVGGLEDIAMTTLDGTREVNVVSSVGCTEEVTLGEDTGVLIVLADGSIELEGKAPDEVRDNVNVVIHEVINVGATDGMADSQVVMDREPLGMAEGNWDAGVDVPGAVSSVT